MMGPHPDYPIEINAGTFGFNQIQSADIERRARNLTVFVFVVAVASFLAGAGAALGSVALFVKGMI